ncbi:MAG: hypothetical protein IKE27_00800 [Oscillospiraceae bacterium]|nr:hypothetical protein [Oscillospiraceae bacterium]
MRLSKAPFVSMAAIPVTAEKTKEGFIKRRLCDLVDAVLLAGLGLVTDISTGVAATADNPVRYEIIMTAIVFFGVFIITSVIDEVRAKSYREYGN